MSLAPTELTALRAVLGQSLGLGSWMIPCDGSPAATAALSDADRRRLYAAIVAWSEGNPGRLSPIQVSAARNLAAMESVQPYTAGDAAAEFFAELGDQAASINENVNPFSATNRAWILGAVVAVAAVYFLAPVVIQALQSQSRGPAARSK